jgi:hypothetical protein
MNQLQKYSSQNSQSIRMEKFLPHTDINREIVLRWVNGQGDKDEEAFPITIPRGDPLTLHVLILRVIVNDKNK